MHFSSILLLIDVDALKVAFKLMYFRLPPFGLHDLNWRNVKTITNPQNSFALLKDPWRKRAIHIFMQPQKIIS